MTQTIPRSRLAAVAPGILVAATGVGAGDLLTAGLAGSAVGLTILWAAGAGAVLKGFLNEGIARWQMATGTTLLEGWVTRLGAWIQWVFLIYLLVWTMFTAGALINACGVAGSGLRPLAHDPTTSKIIWGVIHSLVGAGLVRIGGFRLFEKLMSACIVVMFVTVITTAALAQPDWAGVARGIAVPSIPPGGLPWVLGVLGGVGGTVTLLSYGYWSREAGRTGAAGLRACRLDLTLGYAMTALFGVSMIIIGSSVEVRGKGATVAVDLAAQLAGVIGPAGKWVFLVGFWGAVFSSLLGVWQSVPYLFADFLALRSRATQHDDSEYEHRTNRSLARSASEGSALATGTDLTKTRAYRGYLYAIAVVPLPMLWLSVQRAQLIYAVMGSLFMPLLALTLLIMNNRRTWVGGSFRNGWLTNLVLAATLAFFTYIGGQEAVRGLATLFGE